MPGLEIGRPVSHLFPGPMALRQKAKKGRRTVTRGVLGGPAPTGKRHPSAKRATAPRSEEILPIVRCCRRGRLIRRVLKAAMELFWSSLPPDNGWLSLIVQHLDHKFKPAQLALLS